MMVYVRDICGIGGVPKHRTSASHYIKRIGVSLQSRQSSGGLAEAVAVADLPSAIRMALAEREIERSGIAPGTFDDAAHDYFLKEPLSIQSEAERKAAIVRLLLSAGAHLSWPEKVKLVQGQFGQNGTSKPTLKRL